MAVTTTQLVDLLYKKSFGVTKTDNPTNKSASNESIPSTALIRGDKIWSQSSSIPTLATAVTGIVTAHTLAGDGAVECVADVTSKVIGSVYPTWKTNLEYWIPTEFGASYQVQVWVNDPGASDPTVGGTQLFADGSGGTGQWYFDHQSGVLNFIGETIPTSLTSSKVIYIIGYRYIGQLGISSIPNDSDIGNLNINDNVLSSINTNADIVLDPNGTGNVSVASDLLVNGDIGGDSINVSGTATSGAVDTGEITSTGNISATGDITATGNISATYFYGDGSLLTGIDTSLISNGSTNVRTLENGNIAADVNGVGNVVVITENGLELSGNLYLDSTDGYIYAAGNVIHTDAGYVENNLSVGTLTSRGDASFNNDVNISGNLVVSGETTYVNVTSLDVTDPLLSIGGDSGGGNLTEYDGKDRGLWLRNYNDGENVPYNQAFIWNTANTEFRMLDDVTVSNDIVTDGTYANLRLETLFGNLDGTILTAQQDNITSVGTLESLEVSGTANLSSTTRISSLIASGMQYPTADGTTGQVLTTDGANTLSWATIDTFKIANGTSNVTVHGPDGNVAISVDGTSNVVVVTDTSVVIDGTLEAGNSTLGTVIVDELHIGQLTVGTISASVSGTTSTSIIANIAIDNGVTADNVTGLECFIKSVDTTGTKRSMLTIHAVTDGTDVDWSVYGGASITGSTGANYYLQVVDISGSNYLQLSVEPASTNTYIWTTQYRTI